MTAMSHATPGAPETPAPNSARGFTLISHPPSPFEILDPLYCHTTHLIGRHLRFCYRSKMQRTLTSFLCYNKSKMAAGHHFEKKTENRNNSAAIWGIVTKFGMLVDMDSPQRAVTSFLTGNNIQDGGRPPFWKKKIFINQPLFQIIHQIWYAAWTARNVPDAFLGYNKIQDDSWPPFWKTENRNNSAAIWDVFTNFGTQVDMDRPQRAVTSFLTYNKIQDGSQSLQCWSIELRLLPCVSNLLKS